jgi:hypothetical protein
LSTTNPALPDLASNIRLKIRGNGNRINPCLLNCGSRTLRSSGEPCFLNSRSSGVASNFQTFHVHVSTSLNHLVSSTFMCLHLCIDIIYINKNVNVRLFKILNLRKLFTDGFAILTQRCSRIRACFYIPIIYIYIYIFYVCRCKKCFTL